MLICSILPYCDLAFYGRLLSVAWAKSMLCFANVVLFIYFLWPSYAPAQANGGSRNFYTWWTLSVNREVTTWIFSWSSLNYTRWAKKWRKLAYFETRPANFLLSRPKAAEYCNSEKNLLSTDGFSTTYATFGELWPTNPWDPRASIFLKNDARE